MKALTPRGMRWPERHRLMNQEPIPPLTLSGVITFLWVHWYATSTTIAIIVQWFGSLMANGLDMPTTDDTRWYRFIFRTSLYLAGNKKRADRAADPEPGDVLNTEKKKTTVETKTTQTIVPPDLPKDN